MDVTADSAEMASGPAGGVQPGGRRHRPRWAGPLGIFGELLITAGLLVLLLVVYELYVTGIYTHAQQNKFKKQIAATWTAPPAPNTPSAPFLPVETVQPVGQPMAVLYSPRLGDSWSWVAVEGVGEDQLAKGPGHYPGTALPGQIGNFVVSGHRTTHGAPFFHTDELKPGDAVIVETPQAWYVYRITGQDVVSPNAVSVVLPVPNQPNVTPTQSLLTLTTCNPRYSASQRLIIHGILAETDPKTGPPPAAMTTGVV